MQTYLEEYQEMNDPLLSFCNTYIEDVPVAENAHVPTEDVYKAYRRFCDAGNYRALSDRQFGKDFKKYCANLVRKKRTVPKSQKRAWCYHNIRLLED
jgi:phage/plasmid-associated DNA primase